jgi:hypothetical protein
VGGERRRVPRVAWDLPGAGRGATWIETTWEAWESVHIEGEEIVEPSDDCVVACAPMIGRGHESGAETRLSMWHVFFFTDGLVARRVGPFWAKDATLEAVGLRE